MEGFYTFTCHTVNTGLSICPFLCVDPATLRPLFGGLMFQCTTARPSCSATAGASPRRTGSVNIYKTTSEISPRVVV